MTPRDLIREILTQIGENPDREGLLGTPDRVSKMWDYIFRGYNTNPPFITKFRNGKDGITIDELIIDGGYFFSLCEHHMIPFFGNYYFGYIPGPYIIGASKIARTVDYFSAKLQVAERLVTQVVDFIQEEISPKGQILIMSARHLCKEMRGVQKVNSPFEVIAARGVFKDNTNGCKDEFLARIRKGF